MCLHQNNNHPILNNSFSNGGIVTPTQFSFFKRPVKNTRPSKEITLWDVYLDIKSYRNQPQTALLRSITDKKLAGDYKSEYFDYVTFSGTFASRKNDALIKHSGLMSIDIDGLEDVKALKTALLKDKYFETDLLFTSPSGHGLKWIVSIDTEVYTHAQWFLAIEKYIKEAYDLKIDQACKDVARACFLGYDSEVYIHPKHIQA